jgi:hypothetical protein
MAKIPKWKSQKTNPPEPDGQVNSNNQSIKISKLLDMQVLEIDYLGFGIYLNFDFCYLVLQLSNFITMRPALQ